MENKLYSSLWNYVLPLFTKYAEHRIGKQKFKKSKYNTPNLEISIKFFIFQTILKVVQITQMDFDMAIHAHLHPCYVFSYTTRMDT